MKSNLPNTKNLDLQTQWSVEFKLQAPTDNRCNHGYIEYKKTHISLDMAQQQTKRKPSYNLTRDGEIITYSLNDRSQQTKVFDR
jgi:hypothetical protein